ncbi:hypothetical protein ACFX11_019650 [Malus domestica]
MLEFHKKHFANDLYRLPKACQDTIDLVLTCPDVERIIQKTSDPGLKARFKHIREARVLGFEVDPYTDIDAVDLPFLFDNLQYLRHHFEVFSAISLFGLTVNEMECVARLDAYLDIRDARIMYQEQAHIPPRVPGSIPIPGELKANKHNEKASEETSQKHTIKIGKKDTLNTNPTEGGFIEGGQEGDEPEEKDRNPMGPSILDNMEISMVHVLSADFQPSTYQPNFLDGDVFTEEAIHIDFVTVTEAESTTKDDNLKTAMAKLFPRSSSTNLHPLKSLYVTAHIEGYPVFKIFVDCGATVNIMLVTIMKALRRSNNEFIPSGIIMSNFVGDKSQTKGVLPLEVNIAGRNHMTSFFIIDFKTEYNALLGRDWIHQTSSIPS